MPSSENQTTVILFSTHLESDFTSSADWLYTLINHTV